MTYWGGFRIRGTFVPLRGPYSIRNPTVWGLIFGSLIFVNPQHGLITDIGLRFESAYIEFTVYARRLGRSAGQRPGIEKATLTQQREESA